MKNWPHDNKPADFEELSAPIVDSIRSAYHLVRSNVQDIPYEGLEHNELNFCHGIANSLTRDMLEYNEEQGRDALTVLVNCAIQLGIEQGRRIVTEKNPMKLLILQSLLHSHNVPQHIIDQLVNILDLSA